jgi:Xaa-Pro aminopeptidase
MNLKTSIIGKGADIVFVEMGAGSRSGFPTHPSQYAMRNGDVVHVDFGITYHGYSCDMSRNAVLGKETQEHVKINDALKAGHQEAQRRMKPGLKLSEVFNSTVRAVRENGIPNYMRHHVGHGIGIPPHEPPGINPANDKRLEPGMTLCVETPYYVSTLGGFNIENVVAITKDGCEVISQLGQDLFVLPR